MDGELLKWLSTLGVGGVLAAVIFVFYRKDAKEHEERIVAMATSHRDQIVEMKKDSDRRTDRLEEVVKANTIAVAENTGVTRAMTEALRDRPPQRPNEHWRGGR